MGQGALVRANIVGTATRNTFLLVKSAGVVRNRLRVLGEVGPGAIGADALVVEVLRPAAIRANTLANIIAESRALRDLGIAPSLTDSKINVLGIPSTGKGGEEGRAKGESGEEDRLHIVGSFEEVGCRLEVED